MPRWKIGSVASPSEPCLRSYYSKKAIEKKEKKIAAGSIQTRNILIIRCALYHSTTIAAHSLMTLRSKQSNCLHVDVHRTLGEQIKAFVESVKVP